ncbi:fad binding domain protein [Diplodia corticola]|uniref:Fad binding domain protein n=1 Tax=Diplodia corticola TaxID=236234 RepID=A0A1J9RHM3_9PEZI|nr:fad binding domain protein [Diplodia corticola]OJD32051.1 fad binding domain protein [Diplodia corticola]
MPLRILIVGAGLAGFSAAIALARQGHDVHIFERSAFSNEVGAALHFGPTTTAYVFPQWGIDAYRDFHACKVERWYNYNVKDGVMDPMPDRYNLEARRRELHFEGDEVMCHRVDAHSALREKALSYPNAHLHLSSGVQAVDPDAGTITLNDGTTHRGHVVVGADGIHSQTVQAIAGPECVPTRAGVNIFRFFVQEEKARQNPLAAEFLDAHGYPNAHVSFRGTNGSVSVIYTARNGTYLNFGLLFPASISKRDLTTMDWQAPSDPDEVVDLFYDHPQFFKELIYLGEDFKHWAFPARAVPKSFVRGRLVLIGDAAHPLHPTHATGAVQGVEDAACLGELFTSDATARDVPERLGLYNKLRYERGVTLKITSEVGVLAGVNPDTRLENLRKYVPNGSVPEDPDAYIWLYNPVKEAREALQAHLKSKQSWLPSCTLM